MLPVEKFLLSRRGVVPRYKGFTALPPITRLCCMEAPKYLRACGSRAVHQHLRCERSWPTALISTHRTAVINSNCSSRDNKRLRSVRPADWELPRCRVIQFRPACSQEG